MEFLYKTGFSLEKRFSRDSIDFVVVDCYYQLLTTEGGAVGWTVEMVGNWVTGRKF